MNNELLYEWNEGNIPHRLYKIDKYYEIWDLPVLEKKWLVQEILAPKAISLIEKLLDRKN